MYERAKYLGSKFTRNGIAVFAISVFIIYNAITIGKEITVIAIIFPLAACVWLFLGLRIKKKLKVKVATPEIADERISFKHIESALSILILVSLFLSFRHWPYANYLITVVLIIYMSWFAIQMKMLHNYFNAE